MPPAEGINSTNESVYSADVIRRVPRVWLPAVALLLLISGAFLFHYQRAELSRYEEIGRHNVGVQGEIIRRELQLIREDIRFLSYHSAVVSRVESNRSSGAAERELRLFAETHPVYSQVRLIGLDGLEVVRVNRRDGAVSLTPEADLQQKSSRYYVQATFNLEPAEVYFSPFDLNVEHGTIESPWNPTVRAGTPVYGEEGSLLGMIVLNYSGEHLLNRLREATPSNTGGVYLIDGDGYYLEAPDSDQSWGAQFGLTPTFLQNHAEAFEEFSGESGQYSDDEAIYTYVNISSGLDHDGLEPHLVLSVVSVISNSEISIWRTAVFWVLCWVNVISSIILLLFSWFLAWRSCERESQRLSLVASEERLRRLSSQLLRSAEVERKSFSRDLHDELGQLGTAVSLHLQRAKIAEGLSKKESLIGAAIHANSELLRKVHEVASRVRSAPLEELGLESALLEMIEGYTGATGVEVDLIFGVDELDSAELSYNIYRIIQEGLNNIAKHANVGRARVQLCEENGDLSLTIIDRGVGFEPTDLGFDGGVPAGSTQTFGLLGIYERAELMGGDFSIKAAPGSGVELLLSFKIGRLGGSGEG